jgi:ATP-dependent DNA helicase RecG
VGVNVSNATIMVIESAQRFGLSQLHQLRGRVGRGGDQSYCILVTPDNLSGDSMKRMEIMTSTTDGFKIAEEDLQLRGPGDLQGTMQSGIPFNLKIANLVTDGNLLEEARRLAHEVISADPDHTHSYNEILWKNLKNTHTSDIRWEEIS